MTFSDNILEQEHGDGVLATRFFAIPELSEAILLLLPPEDILLSQRVCKTWKQTIDGSVRLRQILFLEPLPAHTAWISKLKEENDQSTLEEPNTFTTGKHTVLQLPTSQLPYLQTNADETTTTTLKVNLNTLLLHHGHWKHLTLSDRLSRGEGLQLIRRPKHKILGQGRQMFLTQPPCQEILLWVDWGQPHRLYTPEGVRFWQVLEVTEKAGTVLYLPETYMLAKGVVASTEAEEKMVEGELRKGRGEVNGESEGVYDFAQRPAEVASEWNWVSGTVRRWIGW